jgi:hypothetical protein
LALSVKFNEAVSDDVVEGLKVSVTVQLPLMATGLEVEQVAAVMLKSPGFDPGAPTAGAAVKFNEPFPVFITVTVMGALVTPCWTDPNMTGEFMKLTIGMVPVPVSETV